MPQKKNETAPLWQDVSEPEILLKTCVGNVVSQRVRCLRTGAEGDFISLQLFNWVIVLAETPQHEFLLVRQFRHGTKSMQWEFPGGCIDKDDPDPVSAALRELREETGCMGKNARIIGSMLPNPALQQNLCWFVKVDDVLPVSGPDLEDLEDITLYRKTASEIFDLLRSGEMQNGIMAAAWLYCRMNDEKTV